MRDGRLKGIETIVQRQQRVLAKGDDGRLFFRGQHRRLRVFGTRRKIGNRCPVPPLRNCLLIDAVALGQRPQALLTMLYCSTDCLCRRGAAV